MKDLNHKNHIPYNGTVDILVHVANSTDLIVLHAFNINISKVVYGIWWSSRNW